MKRRISLAEFTGEPRFPWSLVIAVTAALVLVGTVGLVVGGLVAQVGL